MKKIIKKFAILLMTIIVYQNVAYATSIQNLKLYSGTINLIRDATTALMVIVPVTCGLCILFFQLRKGMADTQDQQIWAKRTKIAIISCIIGLGASGIVAAITSYYAG